MKHIKDIFYEPPSYSGTRDLKIWAFLCLSLFWILMCGFAIMPMVWLYHKWGVFWFGAM